MAYPSTPTRNANYDQDEQAHLTSPDPAKLDGELNEVFAWAASANNWLRNITTADGHLKNFATGTAESLAGSWEDTATAAQTDFLTDIDWVATFTADNVAVYKNGLRLAASAVAVAEGTGSKLEVTIAACAAGDLVKVDAFESGAGVLTRLASISTGDGASLIGVEDSAGIFSTGADVEGCLYEVKYLLDSTITALGAIGDLIRSDGSVAMAANLPMGNNKVTGLAAGTTAGDAVEYSQFSAIATAWADLTANYMQLDGDAPMTGDLDMGNNNIENVADPVGAQDAATKNYVDTTFVPLAGDVTMTGTLGGSDPVANTDFVTKQFLSTVTGLTGSVYHKSTAGTENWTVPGSGTRARPLIIHCIGAGGGGGGNGQYGGGGGGYSRTLVTKVPGTVLTLTVGAGGPSGLEGGDTQALDGVTVLGNATGGRGSNDGGGAYGVGGTGTVGDLLLAGQHGGYTYSNAGVHGGNAAGPFGGGGGAGGAFTGAAFPGVAPGGGGGSGGSNSAGAAGAAGAIIIEY